ncbi:MAG: dihydropteroate synthase [Verrucomicrobiales bacterium]
MGIVNVTPDSFSDGGRFLHHQTAVEHGLKLMEQGADLIDVGGESTRPGARTVPADEETERILKVVQDLAGHHRLPVSIDTQKAEVAQQALAAGACVINDVSGLHADPEMIRLAASCTVGLVVMHMQGTPQTMQQRPQYEDVVAEVRGFFCERLSLCEQHGVDPARVMFDPGIGFGKKLEHNLALLQAGQALRVADRPILIGHSRKSLLGELIGDRSMDERKWPSVALSAYLALQGADWLRVHDVQECRDAARMAQAIATFKPTCDSKTEIVKTD